ncbi:MAG: hypothetical protein Q9180_008315 [Flavoplaca navasiana]
MGIHNRELERRGAEPVSRKEEMPFTFRKVGINCPGADPALLVEEDDAVLVAADKASDVLRQVGKTPTHDGLGDIVIERRDREKLDPHALGGPGPGMARIR